MYVCMNTREYVNMRVWTPGIEQVFSSNLNLKLLVVINSQKVAGRICLHHTYSVRNYCAPCTLCAHFGCRVHRFLKPVHPVCA